MDNRAMYEALSIKGEVYDFCEKELDGLSDRFREIDEIADFNQLKVIKAMQDAKLSERTSMVQQAMAMMISDGIHWKKPMPMFSERRMP